MKLQKVAVVLGISVCLIATQMQATFGIGETGQGEDSELTREEELEEVDTKKIEQPVIAEEPAVPEQPVITEEPTGTEQSVIADEPQQPIIAEEPVEPERPVITEESTKTEEPKEPAAEGPEEPTAAEKPIEEEITKEDNIFEIEIPKDESDSGEDVPKSEDGAGDEETPKEEDGTGAGEVPKEEDGSGVEEVPKEEDGSGMEELPKDENGSGAEEVPKEEDDPGAEEVPKEEGDPGAEEVPKEEDGSGMEEFPKDENGSGDEEVPKEEDDPGDEEIPKEEDGSGMEELPKDENGSGDEEVPKEDLKKDKEDDVSGTKDHVRDDRPKSKTEEQITKGAEASGKTSKRNNIFSSFTPSSEFIDNREKVKYNVDVPVEGLPGFVTQEMLVGALKCQDETGYPASVTIAQIIQESGFGKYGPDGDKGQGLSYLAYQYNNLFGIKGSGTAGSVAMNTGEQHLDGSRYNITAGFRVYNTYTECIEDRTGLLDRVYKDLTFGVKDANTFAMKIGQRWATSLNYGQNLIRQMERYDLYRLDEMTLDEFSGLIGMFANPCPGARLTSSFGFREAPLAGASTYHKGVDLGTGAYNIPTYAAQAGIVTYAGPSGAAGNLVTIDHGDGLVTKYMHHDKVYVKPGDRVEKGQQIGLSGTTGNSTGNHLHFQVEKNGAVINPLLYLDIQ